MDQQKKTIAAARVRALFSEPIFARLVRLVQRRAEELYIVGGTVRDLLCGRTPADVDCTVASDALGWAREFAALSGGTFVELGREEDAARVVVRGEVFDFSSFRAGARSIEEELALRDLTINALALRVDGLFVPAGAPSPENCALLDPLGGLRDLQNGVIRLCGNRALRDDPLRMLRVFRFAATLDFTISEDALKQVQELRRTIARVSGERVAHELDLIMLSRRAYPAFVQLAACGLLFEIIPELRVGVGMKQPASHHLDVFGHQLEALRQMERIQGEPGLFFARREEVMRSWLKEEKHRCQLLWAALLHDVGKPVTFALNEQKGGRITFYNHDLQGADIISSIGARLRWSRDNAVSASELVANHMRPFFLANNQRQGALSHKACLRLVRKAGESLPALFMLAMADALAGKGEGSPEDMEAELAELFERLWQVRQRDVLPVQTSPPLITGHDLKGILGLTPGPLFREILDHVEEARMEREVSTRKEALELAARYLAER